MPSQFIRIVYVNGGPAEEMEDFPDTGISVFVNPDGACDTEICARLRKKAGKFLIFGHFPKSLQQRFSLQTLDSLTFHL